jgi:hypothetical protein
MGARTPFLASIERGDRVHVLEVKREVEDLKKFSFMREGVTDLGNTISPR